MIPAVIYAAKSTEDVHGSIPDQLADGRALATRRDLEVVAEFQDEAASAYHGDRGPGLASALAACERLSAEHGSCALVVQHSDRLARGDAKQARHLIEIVLWAIKHDVELLSVQDPEILAGGDMALLLGAIGGMRNHQDSKRKSLSVTDGHRRRAVERGQFVGRAPYGYLFEDKCSWSSPVRPRSSNASSVITAMAWVSVRSSGRQRGSRPDPLRRPVARKPCHQDPQRPSLRRQTGLQERDPSGRHEGNPC